MSSRWRLLRLRRPVVVAGLLVALGIVLLGAQATSAAGGGIQPLVGRQLVRADIGVWQKGHVVDVGVDQGVVRSFAGNLLVLVEKDGKVVQIPIAPGAPVIGAPLRGLRPRMIARVLRQPSTGPAYRIEVGEGGGGILPLIGRQLVRADIGVWQKGQVVDVGIDQGVVRTVASDSVVLVEKDEKVVQIPIAPGTPVVGAPFRGLRPRMLARVFRQPSSGPAYRIEVLARTALGSSTAP